MNSKSDTEYIKGRTFSGVLLSLLMLLPCAVLAGETTVLQSVNVISMASGEILANQDVLIRDGRIAAIIPAGQNPNQDQTGGQVQIIDGKGGWLIPGLAEMHAHVPSRTDGDQQARDILMLYLANGITTARGMLGEPSHLALRAALDRQKDWIGPRLITSGPSFNGNSVTSPEQAAQRVRDQHKAGYDFLKLHPGLKAAEFEAIADTANSLGIPFAGHVSVDVGLEATLRQRQATIDHLDGYAQGMVPSDDPLFGEAPAFFGVNLASALDPQRAGALAAETARAGVWNVPTQSLMENLAGEKTVAELTDRPGMEHVGEKTIDTWTKQIRDFRSQMTVENRRLFLAARHALIRELQNIPTGHLLGSDAPQIMNVPGFSIHEELAFMVAAGLTPLQALQSGTINVASFFGLTDSGDTRTGYIADLVLLAENPLVNIDSTRSIEGVVRAGQWYDRQKLDRWLADIRTRKL